jgi:DNA (cytosine-5)-methyltransferase 1
MLRAIKQIQPRWIVGENVFGFTNWSGGMVFEQVLVDLENEGFEAQPLILPAAAVDAPHRRDRVWIVAHKSNTGIEGMQEWKNTIYEPGIITNSINSGSGIGMRNNGNGAQEIQGIEGKQGVELSPVCENGDASYTVQQGSQVWIRPGIRSNGKAQKGTQGSEFARNNTTPGWSEFPTQSPLRVRDDGFSSQLDGITVSKLRNESIKAAGNAIVPQVVFEIFKAIEKYDYLESI